MRPHNDLAATWGPNSAEALSGHQRWYAIPNGTINFYVINRQRPELRDPSIRQAIGLVMDREALNAPHRDASLGRLFPPSFAKADEDLLPTDGSGLAQAEALMGDRRLSITVAIPNPDQCPDCAEFTRLLGAPLSKIGITVEVKVLDYPLEPGDLDDVHLVGGADPGVPPRTRMPSSAFWCRRRRPMTPVRPPEGWLTADERSAIAGLKGLSDPERLDRALAIERRLVQEDPVIVPFAYQVWSSFIGDGVGCPVMQPGVMDLDLVALCPSDRAALGP